MAESNHSPAAIGMPFSTKISNNSLPLRRFGLNFTRGSLQRCSSSVVTVRGHHSAHVPQISSISSNSHSFSSNVQIYDDSEDYHQCDATLSSDCNLAVKEHGILRNLHHDNLRNQAVNQSKLQISKRTEHACENIQTTDDTKHGTKGPHCKTCTCTSAEIQSTDQHTQGNRNIGPLTLQPFEHQPDEDHKQNDLHSIFEQSISQQQLISHPQTCHLPSPLIDPDAPYPLPLPDPTFSFKKRVLPSNLTAFLSNEGKQRFLRALTSNYAESYYPLAQQFLNQSDPAYCGVTTLIIVLNALAMDPNVRWRGGWRWYGDERMLLEHCCLEEERVRREGISIEMFGGLARCQGVEVVLKRPFVDENAVMLIEEDCDGHANVVKSCGIHEFRRDIIQAVRMPPRTELDEDDDANKIQFTDSFFNEERGSKRMYHRSNLAGGFFLVSSFSRRSLNQTGDGHFSPIAAYDEVTDSCLVMDVARFKYAPYWVAVQDLYHAMIPSDSITGKPRGWILMYPPNAIQRRAKSARTSIEEKEGKRPAACVTASGSGMSICPVEKIKVTYCPVHSSE